ncbi:hypothetical protein [[Eubacterium] cellulosolvens]
MKFKKIIEKMLEQKEDLTENDVIALVEEKKNDFQDLLSDEGAALLVAQDLDIDIEQQESLEELQINDLIPNLNDVTITGRVVDVWSIKEFTKRDGKTGKFVRLGFADKTGKIFCIFWDSKAEQISKHEDLQGSLLRILHGYTREGISKEVELHVGERGDYIIAPDVPEQNYPKYDEKRLELHDISNIKQEKNSVNIFAKVIKIGSTKQIKNSDRISNFGTVLLGNKDGIMKAYFWEDKVKLFDKIKEGDTLLIQRAFTKKKFNRIFLTVNSSSSVTINPKNLNPQEILPLKINKLREIKEEKLVSIEGTIVEGPHIKEVITKKGEEIKLASFSIDDGSGQGRILLWRELADSANNLEKGNQIRAIGVYARLKPNDGELELSSNILTNIEKV